MSNKEISARIGTYTRTHSHAGTDVPLPSLEVVLNTFPDNKYTIYLVYPEFTSVCPRTGLPDFGEIHITYSPARLLVEMKSLKLYLQAYRNLGIFQENSVNRILRDFVDIVKPTTCKVLGAFTARGGMRSEIVARYGE